MATGDYHDLKELARRELARLLRVRTVARLDARSASTRRIASIACDRRDGRRVLHRRLPTAPVRERSVRIDNRDFNSRSLNGNAVLRWEYRPGSTMFFVWSTSCAAGTGDPRFSATDAVRRLCAGPVEQHLRGEGELLGEPVITAAESAMSPHNTVACSDAHHYFVAAVSYRRSPPANVSSLFDARARERRA